MDDFQRSFGRRLRAELDGLDIVLPDRRWGHGTHRARAGLRVLRPLALAVAATLALAALATAATRTADPQHWVQPGQWMSWSAIPRPSPTTQPQTHASPSESPETAESPQPRATESEPNDSRQSPSSEQSPEPRESGSPPAEVEADR